MSDARPSAEAIGVSCGNVQWHIRNYITNAEDPDLNLAETVHDLTDLVQGLACCVARIEKFLGTTCRQCDKRVHLDELVFGEREFGGIKDAYWHWGKPQHEGGDRVECGPV